MEIEFSNNVTEAAAACERYENLAKERHGAMPTTYKRSSLLMDLCAADGVNGNTALNWGKLMAFDDFNFLHDVGGISRHIDRETGKLEGFFQPRCGGMQS